MKCKERRYFHVFQLIAVFVVAGWLGWQPARAEGDSKELQAVAQALGKSKLRTSGHRKWKSSRTYPMLRDPRNSWQ